MTHVQPPRDRDVVRRALRERCDATYSPEQRANKWDQPWVSCRDRQAAGVADTARCAHAEQECRQARILRAVSARARNGSTRSFAVRSGGDAAASCRVSAVASRSCGGRASRSGYSLARGRPLTFGMVARRSPSSVFCARLPYRAGRPHALPASLVGQNENVSISSRSGAAAIAQLRAGAEVPTLAAL
jgi:hypothetical protein